MVMNKSLSIIKHYSEIGDSMIKPLTLLNNKINSKVIVDVKGRKEYRGVLDGYDPHMNLVLRSAEEFVNNESRRKMEVAVVRGDNVIFISP